MRPPYAALPFDEAGFFEATAGRSNDEVLRNLFPALGAAERTALATTLPAAAFASHPNLRHTMADFVGFDLHTLTPREQHHA